MDSLRQMDSSVWLTVWPQMQKYCCDFPSSCMIWAGPHHFIFPRVARVILDIGYSPQESVLEVFSEL